MGLIISEFKSVISSFNIYFENKNSPLISPPEPLAHIKSTFSEYGHVAYQLKGNEAYNNMPANVLP